MYPPEARPAEPVVSLACAGCGGRFTVSARRAREHRRLGVEPRCPTCRRIRRHPTQAEVDRYRRWWLDRFTLEELRRLAEVCGCVRLTPLVFQG